MVCLACLIGFALRGTLGPPAGALGFGFFAGCMLLTRMGFALHGLRLALLGAAVLSIVFCRVSAMQDASAKAAAAATAAAGAPAGRAAAAGHLRYRGPVRYVARFVTCSALLLAHATLGAQGGCNDAGHLGACVFRASKGRLGGVHCERADSLSQWERMWTGREETRRVWLPASAPAVQSFGFRMQGEVQDRHLRRAVKGFADGHSIKGWVRNTDDGAVVGRAVGAAADLAAFRKFLSQPGGPVTAVNAGVGEAEAGDGSDAQARVEKVIFNDETLMYHFVDFRVLSKAESDKYEHHHA
eukprot:g1278.t1